MHDEHPILKSVLYNINYIKTKDYKGTYSHC